MEYEVEVIETLKRQKVIEADSLNQALEKLQRRGIVERRQCHSVFSVRGICLLLVLDHQRGL